MCSLTRSTAIAYWMRSFVPMLKKSHLAREDVGRNGGARDFDHRTDFHLRLERLTFALSSALHSSRQASARRNSSKPEIIGYIIFTFPRRSRGGSRVTAP